MLEGSEKFLYIYVVERDFGFAPNPFHGCCTLATCKPRIRKFAKVGDWVMGVGGRRLNATGKCVYLMKVSEVSTFDEYWLDKRFAVKKPHRNGSLVMMVGDNIYHQDNVTNKWLQEDSHHSNPDGSPNIENLQIDTGATNVLISFYFYYFGSSAPNIDLESIGYKNGRGYRKMSFNSEAVVNFVQHIESEYQRDRNIVQADPFDFHKASQRVDQSTRIIT